MAKKSVNKLKFIPSTIQSRFVQNKGKFKGNIKSEEHPFIITQRDIAILVFSIFILISIVGIVYLFNMGEDDVEEILVCGDRTLYDSCSLVRPYFCFNGTLLEKASVCGCPGIMSKEGELCISDYQDSPKQITLKYVLRGEEKEIDYVVYEGLVDYLFNLPKGITSEGSKNLSRIYFKLKNLNEDEQGGLLLPLVIKIQNLTSVREDQMRIAVSLVQNIPYVESEKNYTMRNIVFNYSRYPYEVLYDGAGICGEKSELLAFLLREIGYEVAFFYHAEENHESIGIKCPVKNSLNDTGYCFIETTGPSIITDDSIEYVGGIKLISKPEIALISKGGFLGKDLYEYKDANSLDKIRNGGISFFPSIKFNKLKEKYGLVEEYNLG